MRFFSHLAGVSAWRWEGGVVPSQQAENQHAWFVSRTTCTPLLEKDTHLKRYLAVDLLGAVLPEVSRDEGPFPSVSFFFQ